MTATHLFEHLQSLRAAGLLVSDESDRLSFRHALTREAVYGTLLVRERRRVHQAVAFTIEQLFANALDSHVEDLAYHYAEAGAWDKALQYAQQAGEKAQQRFALREAVEHFTRALDAAQQLALPAPSELHRARGRAFETMGQFERARTDFEAALDGARACRNRQAEWQMLLDLGFLWAARDYARTGEYFEQALALAREMDAPAILAETLDRVGNWQTNRGQVEPALRNQQEALKIFAALDDRRGLAQTHDLLGLTCLQAGDWFAAAAHYEEAIALLRELGDRQGLSSALATYAERATFGVDFFGAPATSVAQAMADADEALRLAGEIGWRSGEAFALLVQGMLFGTAGDFSRALETAGRGSNIIQEIEHRQWLTLSHLVYSFLYGEMLAWTEALAHAEQGLAMARAIGSHVMAVLLDMALARIYIAQAEEARAAGRGIDALPAAIQQIENREDAEALNSHERWRWLRRASVALASGHTRFALRLSDRILSSVTLSNKGAGVPPVRILILQAEALLQLDAPVPVARLESAAEALETARETLCSEGARSQLWQVHIALGKLRRALGHSEAAEAEYMQARAVVDELSATIPDARLREQFRARALAQIPSRARPQPESRSRKKR